MGQFSATFRTIYKGESSPNISCITSLHVEAQHKRNQNTLLLVITCGGFQWEKNMFTSFIGKDLKKIPFIKRKVIKKKKIQN